MKKTKKLCSYMKIRSETEGVEWKLNEFYLDEWFNDGCRQFFGVLLNDDGNLIGDDQEPFEGFFILTTMNLNL
jgi:hypothetical protein